MINNETREFPWRIISVVVAFIFLAFDSTAQYASLLLGLIFLSILPRETSTVGRVVITWSGLMFINSGLYYFGLSRYSSPAVMVLFFPYAAVIGLFWYGVYMARVRFAVNARRNSSRQASL